MSGERAFSFSWCTLATMGAGARTGAGAGARTGAGAGARTGAGAGIGARVSRTVLRILYKSSSEYLEILLAAKEEFARGFSPEGPAGWSDNLLPNLKGGEKSGGAIEGAMEGATEGRSRRGHPRPWTEVILGLTF